MARIAKLNWWKACDKTDEGWPAAGLVTTSQVVAWQVARVWKWKGPHTRVRCRECKCSLVENLSLRSSKCHGCEKQMKTKGKRLDSIVFTNASPRYAGKLDDLQGGDTTSEENNFSSSLTPNWFINYNRAKRGFKKPRRARFSFCGAAKFWKHDISTSSERAFPGLFGDIFGCSTLSKKRCFSTQEFTRFLSTVSSKRRATRSDMSFQT